jgi:hypothetical protein
MSTDPQEQATRAANSTLCAMLQAVAATLAADTRLQVSTVTILTEDKGDFNTNIEAACGTTGTAISVMFAGASGRNTIPGVCFNQSKMIIEIAENAAVNRGNNGRPALETAETCALVVEESADSIGRRYMVDSIVPAPQMPDGADVAYHVILETKNVKIKRS